MNLQIKRRHTHEVCFPEYKENVVLGNGKLQLNPMSYQVIYEGKEIDLTPREFEVLYLLALKPNWVMPKTTIYHSVWGIHYHDDQIPYRTVEYVIWKIRKRWDMILSKRWSMWGIG